MSILNNIDNRKSLLLHYLLKIVDLLKNLPKNDNYKNNEGSDILMLFREFEAQLFNNILLKEEYHGEEFKNFLRLSLFLTRYACSSSSN